MTDINELLAKLNPKVAEKFRVASEIENRILPTPSLGLNMTVGGFGHGRFTTLWGNRSGGKTLLCLQTAAEAQKDSLGVAWIDAEKNFDPIWARRLGCDTDQMLISKITSVADMADAGADLLRAGADVLVIDSVSVLLPQSYFVDKDTGEMKALADSQQIGTYAKNMTSALSMLNNINRDTAIIMISQVRNSIGSYGASKIPMGGEALQHYNSTQLKLWSNPNIKEAIMGKVKNGDLILERPIGRSVTWTAEKTRGPGMNASNSYDLYFDGDYVGVDKIGEILDFGVEYGVIKKGGAWYTVGEERFQGRPAAVKYLRENDDVAEKFYTQILEKASV